MRNLRFVALLGALAAVTIFVSGMVSYRLLFASPNTGAAVASHQGAGARADRVFIQGHGVLTAYHANGQQFAVWKGHNALNGGAKNALANCITGLSTTPVEELGCSNWLQNIAVAASMPAFFREHAPATNVLTNCIDSGAGRICAGWESSATIEITNSGDLNQIITGFGPVFGGTSANGDSAVFDQLVISPPITVAPLDRVIVKITFTIG